MEIHSFQLGPMDNNTYLLVDDETRQAALVDPSFESESLVEEIRKRHCTITVILNTHAHFDHVVGNAFWARQTGAPIALHPLDIPLLETLPFQAERFGFTAEASPAPTILLQGNTTYHLGKTELQVKHTPGHAPGHVVFVAREAVICGDCLFKGSIGRTDLPGGDLPQLLKSIGDHLLVLPDTLRALPGHGPATTVGAERRNNPYLRSLVEADR